MSKLSAIEIVQLELLAFRIRFLGRDARLKFQEAKEKGVPDYVSDRLATAALAIEQADRTLRDWIEKQKGESNV